MFAHPDDGDAYVLRVHNAGSHGSSQLFIRASRSVEWGPDRLAEPLRPDTFADFVLSTTDRTYDIRAVYGDGREQTIVGVDVLAREVLLTY
ncbi:MAG: hypothetical protein QOJ39_2373 [Candidatus Eremiobacteraeota bacterium]|nr:hypothetical protein [Candidatus Eremiobacteraeota bacterium]